MKLPEFFQNFLPKSLIIIQFSTHAYGFLWRRRADGPRQKLYLLKIGISSLEK